MAAILKFILTRLWPVLIPILLYLLWLAYWRKIRKNKDISPFGPAFTWMLATTGVIVATMLIWSVVTVTNLDESYVPTVIKDGALIPSQVEKTP
jgi:hypothetical protein